MPTQPRGAVQGSFGRHRRLQNAGFSLLELVITLAVGLILAGMALPAIRTSIQYFRVRSAVSTITGAIQSTRYRAIFDGCPYNITLNSTSNTFQVGSETNGGNGCAAAFTNVGSTVPFGVTAITLNQNVTLQFKPSGIVTATTGTTTFSLAYGATTKTVTISNYGNVNVTP